MSENNVNESLNETIEIVSGNNDSKPWNPVVGDETLSLFEHLQINTESKNNLRKEGLSIISKCSPPNSNADKKTGLVVGYVQSGKTMSFTAVTALAMDNRYQIIIIITGISIPLFTQSSSRLQTDLRLNTRPDRKWQFFQNPDLKKQDDITISSTLKDWKDSTVPERERQTVLITVMKNYTHLNKLIDVMRSIDLSGVPTLIIDDEADQASLNTLVNEGEESTTYHQLISLRNCFPLHGFLQYTATPQAPLLINIIDTLSPEFVEVLTPGLGYVGGKDFFCQGSKLVKVIPDSEIPTKTHRLFEPPETLLEAMRIFFIGVSAGLVLTGGEGNRSMLVHPSQKTIKHSLYFFWVTQIKDNWEKILEESDSDPDKKELIKEFKSAYIDLSVTVSDLPPFEKITSRLIHAVRKTKVMKINASRGKTPQIDWKASYAYILVGGQAMDRGFTVEGLTVTYMPRDIGVANADTIQQRARFLGYKRGYLGYCRAYLESNAREAYKQYVIHEEDIRSQLIAYRNKSLQEWKRAFFLTKKLKPTRDCVIDLGYYRGGYSDEWFAPKYPYYSVDTINSNRIVVNDFIKTLKFVPDVGHNDRTTVQRHSINSNVPLQAVYEELLVKLKNADPEDSKSYTGLLLQIRNYIEKHPLETCAIYLISHSDKDWIIRNFTLNSENQVENLFAGEYPVSPKEKQGSIYPGDRKIKYQDKLTIQVRRINVSDRLGNQTAQDVYVITVWIPATMGNDWLIQETKG